MKSVQDFRTVIEQAGLVPPAVIPPGKLIRFPGVGKSNGSTSGWLKLFDDGQAGVYGDWATGLSEIWHAARATVMTPQEQAAHRRTIEEAQRIRHEEEQQAHAAAAKQAQTLWNQSAPAPEVHPYLRRKRIQPHGLRVDDQSRLIVPVTIDGVLSSLQFIETEGGKLFLPGGAVKGGAYTLGDLTEASTILICEGFATAASLSEATGLPVVMAFSAGNLRPVAEQLRQQYPTATIRLCADHDQSGTGQRTAREAAAAIGGLVALPETPGRDWNDVHVQFGLDAVRTAIAPAVPCHILDETHRFLRRFICYPSESAHVAHTLWIVHTHLIDEWESTPRLAFLSPEPGSGKTRALEISEILVPRPVEAMNVTPAYLFRKVSDPDGLPTVLFDEIDTLFGPRAKEHEEVRGMLNAGHRHGASAGRCVVRGKLILTEELPAYCAVAMAGLGNLPDTVLSRSVNISMRRRAPGETVEPYRRRLHAPEGYAIREKLAVWAKQIQPTLNTCPIMPDGITDRNADIWESLLSVADAAGDSWPERARVSAVTLVTFARAATPSLAIRLLADLKIVFGQTDAISTLELLNSLTSLEETPWGDLQGKPLDARKLARLLHPYSISSKPIRLAAGVVKGYAREDLHDAWSRYLPPDEPVGDPHEVKVTTVTSDTSNGELLFSEESPC